MLLSLTGSALTSLYVLAIFGVVLSTCANLQAVQNLDKPGLHIPLSPMELGIELNPLGSTRLDQQVHQNYDELSVNEAPPDTHMHQKRYGSGGPYWVSQIKRQGKIAYGNNASYVLWRNVRDWGAVGDGIIDDTDAINNATFDGNRCSHYTLCTSQTTAPAIVYFPPGTYLVSTPLIMLYNTQFIGDANNLPTIKGTPDFQGIALLDSNPYIIYQVQWYENQNNFYRQVRNFVLDITDTPSTSGTHCLHWQVAQATSLQNIVFNMIQGSYGDDNRQVGVYMENGSGGFLEDLIFNGGYWGFFAGNQQFTMRNLTFNFCETGIFQNFGWVFLWKSITFNQCGVGLDMTQGGEYPSVGSLVLQDSIFINNQYGILTSFSANTTPSAAGTLVLDHVTFRNTDPAIAADNATTILAGNPLGDYMVDSFVQGTAYSVHEETQVIHNLTCYEPSANYTRIQQLVSAAPKSASLLDSDGNYVERGRPQYEGIDVSSVKSAFDFGLIGDGITDETAQVQAFLDSIVDGEIAYFDHGAYVITDTVVVPNSIKIVGEIWPMFMITGPNFQDQFNPRVAFRVGQPGDLGTVEISEIIFETIGPTPGAILMEWNLAGTYPGATGMWDVHWRMGGSNGTELQSVQCTKQPKAAHGADPDCWVAFLLLHLTSSASLIMSNNWGWVADHELDYSNHNQIDIYNGRGMLVESQGPVWIYGSSFEHSQLYNYQVSSAKEIYMGIIQSETAYMQVNPNALSSFTPQSSWSDPDFSECSPVDQSCFKTWGLRIFNSTYIFNYGAGLYGFFNNYDSGCLLTETCDGFHVSLTQSEAIYLYALTNVGAEYFVRGDEGSPMASEADNGAGFTQTVALFEYP